jgi:hypothetical protein
VTAVVLPRWDGVPDDAKRCLTDVDAWASTLLSTGIVEAFSESAGTRLATLGGAELLAQLDDFASEFWDFRHGRERNLAVKPELSREQCQVIDQAASVLGLDGTPAPRHTSYDAVILTGGMVRAGIVKPRYLRELYDTGLSWRDGVFLGGFRPYAGDEVGLAAALGVQGNNEFDAMVSGMQRAFDLAAPDSSAGSTTPVAGGEGVAAWREDSWSWRDRMLRVIAAPSSDPERRRANTVDTYRFWASRASGIRSVLVITTPVYVPYQAAGAVEVFGLEFGFSVETVAVSAAASDLGEHSQVFLPRHRIQELRSAVHGLRSLRLRLEELS